MAIKTITYANKTALNTNADIPNINKVTDNDMNEIKEVVNNNATMLGNIIESGSNANGTYIKYDGGIMICFKTITITGVNINNSWGALYESGAIQLGDFAQTFSKRPTIIVEKSVGQGCWLELHDNMSPTSAGRCYVVSATSSTNKNLTFEIIAFGEWE